MEVRSEHHQSKVGSPGLLPALPIASSVSRPSPVDISSPSTPPLSSPLTGPLQPQHLAWETPEPSIPSSSPAFARRPYRGRHSRFDSDDFSRPPVDAINEDASNSTRTPETPHQVTPTSNLAHHAPLPRVQPVMSLSGADGEVVPVLETEEAVVKIVQLDFDNDDLVFPEQRTPSPYVPPGSAATTPLLAALEVGQTLSDQRQTPQGTFRSAGGVLERLREEQERRQRSHRVEVESRRPDYLQRTGIGEPQSVQATDPSSSTSKKHPKTKPARSTVGTSKPASHKRGSSDVVPLAKGAPLRMTRAQSVKEVEEAIAAVDAFEESLRSRGVDGIASPKSNNNRTYSPSPSTKPIVPSPIGDRNTPEAPSQGSTTPRPSTPTNQGSSAKRKAVEIASPSPKLAAPSPRTLTTLVPGGSVGITVSPVKGRRLKLLRPATPPEAAFPPSTQERVSPVLQMWLGTHSHVAPSSSTLASDPSAMSYAIVDSATAPKSNGQYPPPALHCRTGYPDTKRRKLIAAFEDSLLDGPEGSSSELVPVESFALPARQSPLKPARVEGLGRMAIHPGHLQEVRVTSLAAPENPTTLHKTMFGLDGQEDISLMSGVETGGAGLRDLWKNKPPPEEFAGLIPDVEFVDSSPLALDTLNQAISDQGPRWPDSRYPWSLNQLDQKRAKQLKKKERLAMLECFFSRDSDSESDNDTGMLPSAVPSEDDAVVAGARGLWALAQDQPGYPSGLAKPTPRIAERLASLFPIEGASSDLRASLFGATPTPVAPSDPADARIALASRRDIRASLYFASQRREQEEDGTVSCPCGADDDGRAMVRCDACRTWSHQVCVDIRDETELGENWYCPECLRETSSMRGAPTFVESSAGVDNRSLDPRTQQLFGTTGQAEDTSPVLVPSSPNPTSTWPFTMMPQTPKAGDMRTVPTIRSPTTPNTWLDSRFRATPRLFDDPHLTPLPKDALDPTNTPSRGTKYGVAPLPTATPNFPRRPFHDLTFTTPITTSRWRLSGSSAILGPPPAADELPALTLKEAANPPSTPKQHYSRTLQYTDTPIQRSKPAFNGLGPAFALDSPTSRKGKEKA
ncbi:hypothetical protein FRB99_008134 [Tulasnella sp. 403]|nr:hypothetical protein FRB99_008134 [Tulasnella sp. 403]